MPENELENRVVTLTGTTRREHEHVSHAALAQRLAALLRYEFAGEYEARVRGPGHVYFVPDETLLLERARSLGIGGPGDLFGGVVPRRFVASKAITHGLWRNAQASPAGWSPGLAAELRDHVLTGFTAFGAADAAAAGRALLADGALRVKPAHLLGGVGQTVVADPAALDAALAALDPAALREHGVVVEQNIDDARVYSIGAVHVGDLEVAYYGTQREVENHDGDAVYGGSDLQLVRGRMTDLLRLPLEAELRGAIDRALAYDAAVGAAYPELFASRRNYDVLCGTAASGDAACGVLEQSWRIGGASPAEIAALEAFRADRSVQSVRAASREVYGAPDALPGNARVHYDGTDAHAGRLCKYGVVEEQGPANRRRDGAARD